MLTILTTIEKIRFVEDTIKSVYRLDELVTIVQQPNSIEDIKVLTITNNEIKTPLDWYDLEPPYILPTVSLTKDNLLALIFYRLGNHQKSFEFVPQDSTLHNHLLIATHLQFNYWITTEMLEFCHNTSKHNNAIVHYYGVLGNPVDNTGLKQLFKQALAQSENDELKVYTAKHYLNLILDSDDLLEAKKIVEEYLAAAISDDAKNAMKMQYASIRMAQLKMPYDKVELNEIHELQFQSISYYESKGLKIQAGLLLVEASEIANFKQDFIASKELINKAIQFFKEEDIPEFLGEAGLKKAVLLYTWSKNGSPQYYKAAINAFQDVLKVFKRDTHPQKFADIHHNLALIYSEIPVNAEEKPMWTAFCASSFKEVLAFYTKEEYPYEHAMACHNYATALINFPPAKIHDNLEKAKELFNVSLEIRTERSYPFERALTLLNQLELEWLTHNENNGEELKKYEDMMAKAEEIKHLVTDEVLLGKVNDHIRELEKVKSLIQ